MKLRLKCHLANANIVSLAHHAPVNCVSNADSFFCFKNTKIYLNQPMAQLNY